MTPKRLTVFLNNERVEPAMLMEGQRAACVERIRERGEKPVLLVQDTTDFDFSHHPHTSGMGPLENRYMSGFLAHTTLAVSPSGVPFGMWEQEVWVREAARLGQARQRHERAFAEKESYKWVAGLPDLAAAQAETPVVTIGDCEAQIYEFMDQMVQQDVAFIVRACHERSTTLEGEEVFVAVAQWPVQQRYTLSLHRRPDREARDAQVELRWGSLTLKAPPRARPHHPTLTVQVVDVLEPNPPPGEEAVHWLLLTSLPVSTLAQAQQIVTWYTYRWLIERFHYVLKSGCKLEERQLQTQPRLERLLAVFNLVAWRLLWLTYQARQTPDASCLVALSEPEWQALYAHHHHTTRLPTTPPTLQQATCWIAQLGGFLARKSDGDPGVKVLWRGWMRFQDIFDTWQLLHPPLQKDVGNA
jgi:hypothetical protein